MAALMDFPMAYEGTLGKLQETSSALIVGWEIKNMLSLSKDIDKYFQSDLFFFSGTFWFLRIYPNGQSKYKSEGYIGLYLHRMESGPTSRLVSYEFSVKDVKGTQITKRLRSKEYFTCRENLVCGEFFQQSEIISKADGEITIVCLLEHSDAYVVDWRNYELFIGPSAGGNVHFSDSTPPLMPDEAAFGKLAEINSSLIVEWKIGNILSLSEDIDTFYQSHEFHFSGCLWFLRMYPNGETSCKSEGYIAVYLHRTYSGPTSKSILYEISVNDAKGTQISTRLGSEIDFKRNGNSGWSNFSQQSEIISKATGGLTIICSLEHYDEHVVDEVPDLMQYAENEISSNDKMYMVQQIKCPECSAVVYLKDIFKHGCQLKTEKENISIYNKAMDQQINCPECSVVVCLEDMFNHGCQTKTEKEKEKVLQDFKDLMLSGDHSDVIINLKGEEFRLHRSILSARNPFFHSMFKTDLKEKATGIVTIEDCEPDIFRSFVHYIYTGTLETLSNGNVCGLYELAHKYQDDELKAHLLLYMKYTISVDNFCDVIVVALRHDLKELLDKAIDFFSRNLKEIIDSDKWQIFSSENSTQANELQIKRAIHTKFLLLNKN